MPTVKVGAREEMESGTNNKILKPLSSFGMIELLNCHLFVCSIRTIYGPNNCVYVYIYVLILQFNLVLDFFLAYLCIY